MPNILVLDRNGRLPLDLARSQFSDYDDSLSNAVAEDFAKELVAQCVAYAPQRNKQYSIPATQLYGRAIAFSHRTQARRLGLFPGNASNQTRWVWCDNEWYLGGRINFPDKRLMWVDLYDSVEFAYAMSPNFLKGTALCLSGHNHKERGIGGILSGLRSLRDYSKGREFVVFGPTQGKKGNADVRSALSALQGDWEEIDGWLVYVGAKFDAKQKLRALLGKIELARIQKSGNYRPNLYGSHFIVASGYNETLIAKHSVRYMGLFEEQWGKLIGRRGIPVEYLDRKTELHSVFEKLGPRIEAYKQHQPKWITK
jgi:hypothetical protein